MITEDYVSFEVAKLLKEKGFYTPYCHGYYFPELESKTPCISIRVIPKDTDKYLAPTLQMAMKWLREVHKINLHLVPFYGFNREYTDNCKWIYGIDFENKGISLNYPKFNSYEEACEAAIKYCLINLI